jgi:CHAT domain-containing protein
MPSGRNNSNPIADMGIFVRRTHVIIQVAAAWLLLLLALQGDTIAQEKTLEQAGEPQAALTSILKLTPADTTKAFAIVRQCSPIAARTLWWALTLAGQKTFDAGDRLRSLFLYEIAAEAARQARDDGLLAEAEYRLGSIHLHLRHYQQAEEALLLGMRLSEKSNSEVSRINNLCTLGVLYIRLVRYDEAEQVSRQALALVMKSPNRTSVRYLYGEAVACGNLGTISAWKGGNSTALEYLNRAVELFERLDEQTGSYKQEVLDNLISIGEVYYNLGDYREALQYYNKVLPAAEKHGYQSRLKTVLMDLGNLYLDQADFGRATALFTRSLQIAAEIGDREAEIIATCNLGVTHERQMKYERAGELFENCLRLADQSAVPNLRILALEGLATLYRRSGQFERALEYYERALQIATKLGEKLRQSELEWWKAGVYYDLGDYTRSIELSTVAGNLADEIHETNYSYLALTLRGKNHLALEQYEPARESLKLAIEKAEQIRSRIGGQEQQRAFFFERKIEPYYLMVDLLVRQNKPEEALEFAEQARSRTLLDLIGNVKLDIAKAMSPAEKEEERKLDGQLAALNTQLYREYQQKDPDKNRIGDLKIRLEKARVDYDSFLDRLFVDHPELRIDRGRSAPFTIGDAMHALPSPDAAVVEFEVLEDKVYVFTVAGGADGTIQVRAHSVAVGKKNLTERVDQFRERIANNSMGIDKPSAELYQLLLGPAAPMITGKKTLILVPDDVLWEMPFQALKDSAGRYLIENHAIFYAPSLTALREIKKRESGRLAAGGAPKPAAIPGYSSRPTLLAFGDPAISSETVERLRSVDRDEKLGPLPATKKEVETLGNLYGASRSKVFVGARATEERAKLDMARFRILHFATHGVLDGANPLYSHLVLSQSGSDSSEDGLLEAREIMNMNLEADLAVLSACQTARGRISTGEGVIGMSWALFVAGCPTTVVSQWSVESDSTTKLMIDFHRALLSLNRDSVRVRGSAQALREAALKMLKSPGYRHPFYWAGFIVVGDGW